jgi:hypothetical protein
MDNEDRALALMREHEYGKEVSWSREKMWKASIAAATEIVNGQKSYV